jgi:hypothetical protein
VYKTTTKHHTTVAIALGIVISRRGSDHKCVYSHIQYVKDETSFRVNTSGGG